MKLVKSLLYDLVLVLISPLYLAGLILGLPYLIWRWTAGIAQTARGQAPSYETEFDAPREYGKNPTPQRIDDPAPSLQAYIRNDTQINSTYNTTIDNSTHIDNSTDSHAQTINNYYFAGQPVPPQEPKAIDATVTFTPDEATLSHPQSPALPPEQAPQIGGPEQAPALPGQVERHDQEVR